MSLDECLIFVWPQECSPKLSISQVLSLNYLAYSLAYIFFALPVFSQPQYTITFVFEHSLSS